MGNQNNIQKRSWRSTTANHDISDRQKIIDLDEIVEQWVWNMWNRTKTKSLSHYKREELLIIINWKQVIFTQSNAHFYGVSSERLPKSQVLFRTNFNNKTNNEQSYLFKTERFTCSIFKFTFIDKLTISQESAIILRLPEEIVKLSGGIKREQSVEFGQDTIKEYNMRWSVDSQICVPSRTHIYAELNIDEEEFNGDFSVFIRFYGRIKATIATRQSPNTYLKFFDGDIIQIIREIMENNHQLNGLEFLDENPPVIQFKMRGKCSFRYGIEQHVILNQESLEPLSSSISTQNYISSVSSNYRPLRTHLKSLNNDIHLHIENDERL